MTWRVLTGALFASAMLVCAACGGSNSQLPGPHGVEPTPFSASTSVELAPTAVATQFPVTLASAGGYSAGASIPVAPQSIPQGTTLSSILTDRSPLDAPAVADAVRKSAATTAPVTPLVYFSLSFSKTVTLPGVPSFSIALPPGFTIPPNTTFSLALYDPTQPQSGWQLGFEGPAVANAGKIVFAGSSVPITFKASYTYWFMVYATTSPTPVPIPSQSPFVATHSEPLSAAVALPTASGYSGNVAFPVPQYGIPAGTNITETLQDTPPSAAPSLSALLRGPGVHTMSATQDSSIVYVSLALSDTIAFSPAPSFAITLPPNVSVAAGASYYLALYDPENPSAGWQLDFEGPASINGRQLNFSGATTSLTFVVNQTYWFALYARSSSDPPPTPLPSPTTGATPGAMLAVPGSFSFLAAGVRQTLNVSETAYSGAFSAATSNAQVAKVNATSANTFDITAVSAGTATVTVSDSLGQTVAVPVTVTTTTIPIQ